MRTHLAVAALLTSACTGGVSRDDADLVVLDGAIHTAEPTSPVVNGLAVKAGRFVAVGDREEVAKLIGPDTQVLELEGETVLPGLIDGHVHLGSGIALVRGVNLYGIAEKARWLEMVAAKAEGLPPGEWIVGGRWDHTLTPGADLPTKEELDRVAPEHPVALSDVDGHSTWVNSLALSIGGVDRGTADPTGGEIVRDASGEPTGVLFETAGSLVTSKIPDLAGEERLQAIRDTLRYASSRGLTGAHDMSDHLEAYVELAEAGELPLRVWLGGFASDTAELEALLEARNRVRARLASIEAQNGPLLDVGYVKHFADGVLSTRTAALLAPYADDPSETGLPRYTQTELDALVADANAAGFPVAIHAIGDKAVRMSLDAFEASPGGQSLANRIEHIELVHPDDAERFGALGVLASMHPHHCITGIDVYNTDRLGPERAAWSFAWNALREQGATLVFGSDWATAPLDPLHQLYAAVLREKPAGGPAGGWHPHNAVGFDVALRAYTQAPADASGWGDAVGSIRVGKWADFVVLDGKLPEPLDRSILDRRVRATYLSGKRVYPQ